MKIAVKDANVFIDLESMGLLDLWFQLGHVTLTSSYVVVELEDGGHLNALATIRAGQVQEATITGLEMEEFDAFQRPYQSSGLSLSDVSVLYLAIRENAMLLSGDRLLRNQAKLHTVEVHGTLWILDQLVESKLLDRIVAAQRLEALLLRTGKEQRHLPKPECQTRIARWSRG